MILPYTILQAKKLNVTVKPSTNKNKKLDVFKDNKKIASVGAKGYADYPTYIKTHGKQYADTRRELYKKRHEKDRHKIDSNGYYADKLLW
jgi:predicted Zn-dependent protease